MTQLITKWISDMASPAFDPTTWVKAFRMLVSTFRNSFGTSLLTCLLLLALGLGYRIFINDGEIAPGIRVQIISDRDELLAQDRAKKAEEERFHLRLVAQADTVLVGILGALLAEIPGSIRAKVGLAHNGAFALGGLHIMRYSVTHSLAIEGRTALAPVQGQPLSEWSGFLSKLLDKEKSCILITDTDMTTPNTFRNWKAMGTKVSSICGVWTPRGIFLGALFLTFERNEDVPTDMRRLYAIQGKASLQIGAALAAVELAPKIEPPNK